MVIAIIVRTNELVNFFIDLGVFDFKNYSLKVQNKNFPLKIMLL